MKKTIFKKTSIGLLLFTPFFSLISCASDEKRVWDNDLIFGFKTPWAKISKANKLIFENQWANEINKLKNEDKSLQDNANVKVFINIASSNDTTLVQDVSSKKLDMAISSIYSVNNDANAEDIFPILQTRTTSFKFDQEYSVYKNGYDDDPLRVIAKKTTDFWKEKPFSTLNDQQDGWTGSRYNKFYNINKIVDFYRGAIWVWGDQATRRKIIKAWHDREFEVFRNFGILHGKTSTDGGWKLQKALLKKHFKNFFQNTTLEEDKQKNGEKYKVGTGSSVNSASKFHILFENEGSFAWTYSPTYQTYLKPQQINENIEVLTVTDPIKYDIGYFRTNMLKKQAKIITQALINIQKRQKYDTIGPKIGYNGYSMIKEQDIEEEIYGKYQRAIS